MMTLVAILTIVLVGLVPLLASRRRLPVEVTAGASFLLGSGIVAASMLWLSLVGSRWHPLPLALLIATVVVLLSLWFRTTPGDWTADAPLWSKWSIPFDVVLVILIVLNLVWVTDTAPREWDYWAEWGLKARIFFEAGWTIDWSFLESPDHHYIHPDYPPLVPLLFDYVAMWHGEWNDRWFGVIDWMLGLSLLSIVRGFLRSRLEATGASIVTLVVASMVLPQRTGMADVALVAFVTAGLILLSEQATSEIRLPSVIGILFLAFAALSKNEGLTFSTAALAVAFFFTRNRRGLVMPAAIAVVIAGSWQVARMAHGLEGDLAEAGALGRLSERLTTIGEWLPLLVERSILLPAVLLILLLVVALRWRLPRWTLLILIPTFIQAFAYLGAYMITPHDIGWHIQWSWSRIETHLVVPVLFVVATVITRAVTDPGSPTRD